jgi:chromosome segregation protein
MFLKSLTLKGFKSFADTTVMELEPGVTVVVGPNGSGKSNVVDAIAWVLGAQAPSSVRSQKMDDVIFAGTSKRPALGRAEVVLTIDNSAGLLPIEFSEVSVSRTLFRSGESEYAINGINCRLLDVQDLLSDAGVGRQQHVIVSQGQIDAVLNARPEDRRAIIEEASGVLKHRKRKEKAERRLEGTEANLLRAQDLLREVRRQLRPLERQADAARRHGAVAAEMRNLQLYIAGREIAALRSRLENSAVSKVEGEANEKTLRARLASLDTAVMADEAELTARGESGVSDDLVRVEQLLGRARGQIAVLAERRRSVERDRGQLADSGVIASLEADAATAREELERVSSALSELSNQEVELARDEAALIADQAQDAQSAQQAVRDAESALDAATTTYAKAVAASAGDNARVETLRASVAANASSLGELTNATGALGALSDLIEIDADWQSAIHAGLSDALNAMVMSDATSAREALNKLQKSDAMGAVLSLGDWTSKIAPVAVQGASSLRSYVRAKAGATSNAVNSLLDALLARVVFVDLFERGIDIVLERPDVVVVTSKGDRLATTSLRVGPNAVTSAALERAEARAIASANVLVEAESALNLRRVEVASVRERLAGVRSTQVDIDSRATSVVARRREFDAKAAGLRERKGLVDARLAEIESRLQADQGARSAASDQRSRVEAVLGAVVRLSSIVEGHVRTLEAQQIELQELRRRQSSEVREISHRLDEARRERSEIEKQLEGQRERNRRVELEESEVKVRLEGAIETLRRDLEVEPQRAIDTPLPELPEGTNPLARQRELERELRLMGPINPLALEEFTELQLRNTFLEEQLEDVKNSRRELMKVIKQVDQEIQSNFAAAYADVRDNFTKLFAMLFPGGTGRLTLTNPDDLLNTGIEVEAKPSGKNVKKLSLLSGGERSLTALAYLFAVFRSRPSPFYVMDEVEAALDDVNLHRFLALVHEFRQEAQLLIVSHQKRTMEAGDSLLGVTMQPGGSSRVVVERVTAQSA